MSRRFTPALAALTLLVAAHGAAHADELRRPCGPAATVLLRIEIDADARIEVAGLEHPVEHPGRGELLPLEPLPSPQSEALLEALAGR